MDTNTDINDSKKKWNVYKQRLVNSTSNTKKKNRKKWNG